MKWNTENTVLHHQRQVCVCVLSVCHFTFCYLSVDVFCLSSLLFGFARTVLQPNKSQPLLASTCRAPPPQGSFLHTGHVTSSKKRRVVFRASFLLQALALADMLAKDADLREVVCRALRLVLPRGMAEPLVAAVEDDRILPMPNQGTISRWRLLVDSAFMLHMRSLNNTKKWVRFMMVDSSTQGGRDFELILLCNVACDEVVRLFDLANQLIFLRCLCWSAQVPCGPTKS